MAAYLIAQIRIHDPQTYKEYAARTPGVIAQYGGRFLVRGGATEIFEGDAHERRVIILEFPSMEAARTFYHSPEYQEILGIRTAASQAELMIVEGIK